MGLRRFQQGLASIPAVPEVGDIHSPKPGEENVSNVRARLRAAVPTPDIAQQNQLDAVLARPAMFPVAYTERDTIGEDRRLLGMKVIPAQPGAQADNLQQMGSTDLRRANSFRAVPAPWDEGLIHG